MLSSAPNLSRYQPAILLAAGLAAATSIYLVYIVSFEFDHQDEPRTPNLHRRNAVRRRTRQSSSSGGIPNGILEDVSYDSTANAAEPYSLQQQSSQISRVELEDVATEASFDGNDEHSDEEGQKLRELMFAISKNKAKNEGLIHRGVTCDNCGRVPIVGIRYHCTNCPDFDLCEDCEAQECHLKTHIFYKVRVPASWGGKNPTPVWYPGRPQDLPPELDHGVKQRLSERSQFKSNRIDGLYQQFSCLANKPLENDPCHLGMGIDKVAFDRCFVAQSANKTQPYPNLVHDRLFRFFDEDRDGLIGFEEFIMGMTLAQSKDKEDRKLRIFKSLDLDDDGFISRKDLLRFFRANFILNKNIMVEYLKADRTGDHAERVTDHIAARDFISSGRPLSSYFGQGLPEFGQPFRENSHKVLDGFGDQVPSHDGISAVDGDIQGRDLISREEAISNMWIFAFDLVENDICRAIEFKDLIWTTAEDIRAFDKPTRVPMSHPAAEIIIRPSSPELLEEDDKMWAKFRYNSRRAGCLRVTTKDVEEVLGSVAANHRDWKNDQRSLTHIIAEARDRICRDVRARMRNAALSNLDDREYYHKFHLKEERNAKFNKFDGRRISHLSYISDDDSDTDTDSDSDSHEGNDDYDNNHNGAGNEKLLISSSSPLTLQPRGNVGNAGGSGLRGQTERRASIGMNSIHKARVPKFIGDSPAAQTIYTVTQQALNELLDPLFKQTEDLALDIALSHDERQYRHGEIQKALKQGQGREDAGQIEREAEWREAIETCFRSFLWPEKSVEAAASGILQAILAHNQSHRRFTSKLWSEEEQEVLRAIAAALRDNKLREVQRMLLDRIDQLESFRRRRLPIGAPPPSPVPASPPIPVEDATSSASPISNVDEHGNIIASTTQSSPSSSSLARTPSDDSRDPTMPQNRPSNDSSSRQRHSSVILNAENVSLTVPHELTSSLSVPEHDSENTPEYKPGHVSERRPKMPPEQLYKPQTPLYRLVYLHNQEQLLFERGCFPGCLNFEQFSKKIEETEDQGEKALKWMEGWLDMVMF